MVDDGDLVMQDIAIGLVAVDSLLDDALIVRVQRKAGAVQGAQALESARLHLQEIVAAGPAGIDPLADGIAREGGIDVAGPAAAVGKNSAGFLQGGPSEGGDFPPV